MADAGDEGGFGQFMEPLDNVIKPAISQFDAFKSGWDQYLQHPGMAGAALSFAGQLAQPPQFGQNGFGHLMEAVGTAGSGIRQTEALDMKQQEADSKQALRESQADQATSRAGAAESRSNSAADRMRLEEARQSGLQDRALMKGQSSFLHEFRVAEQARDKEISDAKLLRQTPKERLTFDEFIRSRPQAAATFGLSPMDKGPANGDVPIGTTSGQTKPMAQATPTAQTQQPFSKGMPNTQAKDKLKANPKLKDEFDRQFGPGSAAALGY